MGFGKIHLNANLFAPVYCAMILNHFRHANVNVSLDGQIDGQPNGGCVENGRQNGGAIGKNAAPKRRQTVQLIGFKA